MSEADQNLEETVKIIKNLQKTLFTWRVFVCYTTKVASHAHLLRVQKYTRSEIPADAHDRYRYLLWNKKEQKASVFLRLPFCS